MNLSGDPGAGTVGASDGLLRRNTTSAAAYRIVQVNWVSGEDLLFTYAHPDGALRLSGYTPFVVDASVPYRFCTTPNCGAGVVAVVSVCLQYVASAIVATVNFFVLVGNVLAQFGAWLWNAVQTAAAAVASAVQAAATVVGQIVTWAVGFVTDLLKLLVKPVLDAIDAYLVGLRSTVQAAAMEIEGSNPSPEEHAERAATIVGGLFLGGTFLLFWALALALLAVEIATKPITAVVGVVTQLVVGVAMGLIFGALFSSAIPVSNENTGSSPDNVDAIPEFVVDYIPPDAWWNARAPLSVGRFLSTLLILLARQFLLDDPLSTKTLAVTLLASVTGLGLFLVSPQLSGVGSLLGTAVGFALSLYGLVKAIGSSLRTLAPILYYVSLALAVASVAMGVGSVLRLG